MAKSSKKNDFLEILMLTGFFCTVFFACFGGYFWWQKEAALEARDIARRQDKLLEEMFEDPERRDQRIQELRVQESKRDAASLNEAIEEVRNLMGASAPEIGDRNQDRGNNRNTGKVRAEAYTFTFKPNRLDTYLTFLQLLQQKKPHIKMRDVELKVSKRQQRRGEAASSGPDVWELKLEVVTYTSDADGDSAPKP